MAPIHIEHATDGQVYVGKQAVGNITNLPNRYSATESQQFSGMVESVGVPQGVLVETTADTIGGYVNGVFVGLGEQVFHGDLGFTGISPQGLLQAIRT